MPQRILEHEQSEDGVPGSSEAEVVEDAVDVQLARAVEVLKSWTYFEDLRELRQQRQGTGAEGATVAAAEADGA